MLTWIPQEDEEFFVVSFHVVENAEPFAIIIYPQMMQYDYENKNVYCFVSNPPFSYGKIRISSFSEKNPDIYGKPIRTEIIDF